MRWIAGLAVVLLAACSGDDSASTTTTSTTASATTTAPECGGWRVGELHDDPPECLPLVLESLAESEDVTLTPDADAQAAALCRSIDVSGFGEAMALTFVEWGDGSRPSPADDPSAFVPLAVAVYCPEHFQALRDLND